MSSAVERAAISLHIGQCGTQIGQAVWELLTAEHEFTPTGVALHSEKIGKDNTFRAFYYQTEANQFVPRAVFVDLEPTCIDEIRVGPYRNLFHPDQLINGLEDASNNFSRGYYSNGKTVMAPYMNSIRKLAESSDSLQGFLASSSSGGGTGSGFGSLVFEYLADRYPKTPTVSLQVAPSPHLVTCLVEPYNAVLNTHFQFDNCDVNFIVDNEAIYDICRDQLSIFSPTFVHVNRLISQIWSAITVSFRFEGKSNVDLNSLQTNLIPYPRMHFPIISYYPLVCKSRAHHQALTVDEITRAVFDPNSQFACLDIDEGKNMAVSLLYRGDVTSSEVHKTIGCIKNTYDLKFVDWCPTGYKVGVNSQPPTVVESSRIAPTSRNVTMLTNNTAVGHIWKRVIQKTQKLFSKRAFVHWFVGDGMEEGEINDAIENLSTLIKDYHECGLDTEIAEGEMDGNGAQPEQTEGVESGEV